MEDHLFINPVDKLWTIGLLQLFKHAFFHIGLVKSDIFGTKANGLIIPRAICSQV